MIQSIPPVQTNSVRDRRFLSSHALEEKQNPSTTINKEKLSQKTIVPQKGDMTNAIANVISPTNIIIGLLIIGMTETIMSLLVPREHNHEKPHNEHADIHRLHNIRDILDYSLQIAASILSWKVLSKIVPRIDIKFRKKTPLRPLVRIRPTESFQKHQGKIHKVLQDGLLDFAQSWKSTLATIGSFTLIQSLTDHVSEQIDDKPTRLAILILSFIAKIMSVSAVDNFINGGKLTPSMFWQSFVETCECCGNPRLACMQIAPVIVDIVKSNPSSSPVSQYNSAISQYGLTNKTV